MKHVTCLIVLTCCFGFSAYSQWITLYEGGAGTPNSLNADWSKRYFFASSPGSNNSESFGSFADVSNKLKMLYYLSDFGSGSAGMYKVIPGMEQYASLRIYLEMDLPDSIGTIHYAALNDELFADSVNNSLIDDFAAGQFGVTIPYANNAGYNSLYLFADLLRGDSVVVWFNYVRIEADTTQMLGLSPLSASGLNAYSSANTLFIQSADQHSPYEVNVFNTLGANVFQGTFSGNQQLPMDEPGTGTYLVQVTGENNQSIRKKIYIE